MNHSQKRNEKPLTPWIISEKEGKIHAAHCYYMAGLGETCSHVATLFWAIATGVEKRDSLTVTQKSAYCVILPSVKKVLYATLASIAFVGKRKRLHPSITANSGTLSLMAVINQ